jgi:acyl dehydratase
MTNTETTGKLYLDDLKVGDVFRSSTYTMETTAIKTFALAFDPQPFHLDEAAADKSFFAGLAASGWHTAAASMRLFVESLPIAGGLIGAGCELSWPRPTRPGDVLHLESTITNIAPSRSKPERGIVTVRSETRNQREEPCQVMQSKLLVFRRPDTARTGHPLAQGSMIFQAAGS